MRSAFRLTATALGALVFLSCASASGMRTSALPPSERTHTIARQSDQPAAFAALQPQTTERRSVPRIGTIRGEVVGVTPNRIEIIGHALAGSTAKMTLFVGGVTQVTLDGRVARFGEIQPGMDVEASYTQERSTVIAGHIKAKSPPSPAGE